VRVLTWLEREFQSVGEAAAKALSPQVRSFVLMGCSRLASADLRRRVGARLLRALKVKSNILKSMRCLVGGI